MARISVNEAMEAMRKGQILPMPAMLEVLQVYKAMFRAVARQCVDLKGEVREDAPPELQKLLYERGEAYLHAAQLAAPYLHPKLATVDFVASDEVKRSVIRAPAVTSDSNSWDAENRAQGLIIDVTPGKAN